MKAIYTVITGNYDTIPQAPNFNGWDAILFTDIELTDSKGWKVVKAPKTDNKLLQSRYYKIMSHIELSEYRLVCYIDGNQRFIAEPPNKPIWFAHPRRNCIFEEAKQVIKQNKAPFCLVSKQIKHYKDNDYKSVGLFMNGFFIRKHREDINRLHEVWYEETAKFSHRDQLSLPYAIYKTGIMPESVRSARIKELYAIIIKQH